MFIESLLVALLIIFLYLALYEAYVSHRRDKDGE